MHIFLSGEMGIIFIESVTVYDPILGFDCYFSLLNSELISSFEQLSLQMIGVKEDVNS